MAIFQKLKLGSIANEKREAYLPCAAEDIPYIGLEHIEQKTLRLSGIGKSSDVMSLKKHFIAGDVLYGSLRPYFRKIYKPKFNGVCSTDITVLKPKSNCNSSYLFYLIASPEFIAKASGVGNGTKMPRAGWKLVKDFTFDVPNLPIQINIACVLSAYDDLIENNEKRIKALEEMAQLLYTEWFVKLKFPGHEKVRMVDSGTEYGVIPEGWEVRKLGGCITVKKGKNITKGTVSSGYVPVVAGGLEPAYFHNTSNTKSPVVTISASGANAGFTRLYFQDVWASDCSFVDLTVTPEVYFYYLFLLNKKDEIARLQRGAAQPHVYPKDLMSLKLIFPEESLVKIFNARVQSFYDLVRTFEYRNNRLSRMRDLLIPQLVTGTRDLKS